MRPFASWIGNTVSKGFYFQVITDLTTSTRRSALMAMKYTRLTEPLVRDRGELRPASWEEALDRAAEGFQRTQARYGGDAIGTFSCSKASNEVNFLANKLARIAFGTHNIDS